MRWPWRHETEEPEQDKNQMDDLDARLHDAGEQLAESKARASRARALAAESRRLIERNNITGLIVDSIINPRQ